MPPRNPNHPIERELNSKFSQLGEILGVVIPNKLSVYDQDLVNQNFDLLIIKAKELHGKD